MNRRKSTEGPDAPEADERNEERIAPRDETADADDADASINDVDVDDEDAAIEQEEGESR